MEIGERGACQWHPLDAQVPFRKDPARTYVRNCLSLGIPCSSCFSPSTPVYSLSSSASTSPPFSGYPSFPRDPSPPPSPASSREVCEWLWLKCGFSAMSGLWLPPVPHVSRWLNGSLWEPRGCLRPPVQSGEMAPRLTGDSGQEDWPTGPLQEPRNWGPCRTHRRRHLPRPDKQLSK